MWKPLRNALLVAAGLAGLAFVGLRRAEDRAQPIPFPTDEAYAIVAKLSGPDLEGRLTGSAGNRKAMEIVASRFREIGLEPFTNTGDYLQPFDACVPELRSVPVLEIHGPSGVLKRYTQYVDFRETFAGYARPGEVRGRGRALSTVEALDSPAEPIFLYDHEDPTTLDEGPLFRNGIKGVLLRTEDRRVTIKGGSITSHAFDERTGFVKLLVTGRVMEEIKRFLAAGHTIRMKSDFSMRWVQTANVAGFLPAADGSVDDLQVISCHLDHLGQTLEGRHYPGALDNASGTGVMVALARAIASHRDRLSKAFVFVAFNAEEQYLGGSWQLVNKPPLRPSHVEVLNFDMVGSREEVSLKLESAVISAHDDPLDPMVVPMEDRIREIAGRRNLQVDIDHKSYGSDHVPFAARAIPALTFIHFAQGDYHTTRDDLSTVSQPRLRQVGQIALEYLQETTFRKPLQWLHNLMGGLVLVTALGALGCEVLRRVRERRRRFYEIAGCLDRDAQRPLLWASNAILPAWMLGGLSVFPLALLYFGPWLGRSAVLEQRDGELLAEASLRHGAACTTSDRWPRPVPSQENDAMAEYLAAQFESLGLRPYRQKPGEKVENYFLESRSMLPVQKAAPSLQLLAADGTVIRTYTRGRDYLETILGNGGGGRAEGPYRFVRSAYDLADMKGTIICLRRTDLQVRDEALFASWGTQALLVEGDPAAPIAPDYSDEKNGQLLKGATYLRFVVTPAVLDELAVNERRGARLRAEWRVEFEWIYPRTVVGCIPGHEAGENNELIIATALDTPQAMAVEGKSTALPFFLALAEVLVQKNLKPKHPIVFIAFNGSHAGHLGSRAYHQSPMTFKEPRKDHWMGETEDSYGLVGNYVLNANKAFSRFASGRHVVNLIDGTGKGSILEVGSETPFFRMPAKDLVGELVRASDARSLPMQVRYAPTQDDHRVFADAGNPAMTVVLPSISASGGTPVDMAAILAQLVQMDAVAPVPTPLDWVYLVLKSLGMAILSALGLRWVMRRLEERRPHAPDPYAEFLKRSNRVQETPGEL
jgi:Zn-dependent M28 family amino/carboxypeptidase